MVFSDSTNREKRKAFQKLPVKLKEAISWLLIKQTEFNSGSPRSKWKKKELNLRGQIIRRGFKQ